MSLTPKPIVADQKWQTIVLYSESGAGKTSLAATAPKPLILDSNKGTLSIANRPGLDHVRSIDVDSMDDLDVAYDNFAGRGKSDWAKKFNTIVFDHWDDMQGIVLDGLVEKAMAKDDRRDDAIEQREYGIMGNKLRRYIRKFKRLPCHKILICGMSTDFESGEARPAMVGQLKSQIKYFADHTMYLRIGKKGVRYLHLDPKPDEFYAKTRAHWLAPEDRKIRIDFNNPKQFTEILARIAAAPRK